MGLALISPVASVMLGHLLYSLTGEWNVEDFLGHVCYLVAISAVVYNAIQRLGDDQHTQRSFRLNVEYPLTLCIPLMLAAFSMGNGAKVYRANFFEVPTDTWLGLYCILGCGISGHLIIYGFRALLVLWHDPKSRDVATFYLAGSLGALLGCLVGLVNADAPALKTAGHGDAIWWFACMYAISFALGGRYSWLKKLERSQRSRGW
jgi:hypothetical protein